MELARSMPRAAPAVLSPHELGDKAGQLGEAGQLGDEARRLDTLYNAYVGDQQFLAESSKNMILYYVDAHELTAFINPDGRGKLQGFVIDAERLHPEAGGPFQDRRLLIALRHDQVLSGLLFDPANTVGLLPSHAEEMDDEVEFQLHRSFGPKLALVTQARGEIGRIRPSPQSLFAAVDRENTPQARSDLVRFFQTHAPVLTALLRDDLDNSRSRLRAVLNPKRLRLHERITWDDLAVAQSARGAEPYGELAPASTDVERLRSFLSRLDYRRNSERANWLDASALAHVRHLRAELQRRGVMHVRVLLVSRARTLLKAAIRLAEDHQEPLVIRHPRLLAMMSDDARKLDGAADLTLSTALAVYLAHLELTRTEPLDIPKATGAFLAAWDAFESSRLAVEAKWRAQIPARPGGTMDAQMYQRLLRLFCSDQDAPKVLTDSLFTSFAEFGEAASRFLLSDAESRKPAQLNRIAASDLVHLTPLSATGAGPLQVGAWDGMAPDGERLPLDSVAQLVKSRSEGILVWALTLACAGRWKSAALFAQSARQLAELQRDHQAAADEARLLRAQIRRLGGPASVDADDDAPDAAARYERAMAELRLVALPSNAGRRLREQAAQTAEAFLQNVALPADAPSVRSLADGLDGLIDAEPVDVIQARLISTFLMLHLMRARRPEFWLGWGLHDLRRASDRHQRLVTTLRALPPQQTDALSHRSRVLALIGFAVFSMPKESILKKGAPAVVAEPGPLCIPEDLRPEMPDLISGLEPESDGIADLLRTELKAIDTTLRRATAPNLLLASVRMPWVSRKLAEAPEGSPERQALTALELTALCMEGFATEGINAENEVKIGTALRTLATVSGNWQQSDRLSFHVKMEHLYLRLITATILPARRRSDAFAKLRRDYTAISLEYPDAALPHCRLSYLAEEASLPEEALASIQNAFTRVDADPYLDPDPEERPHWIQSLVRRRLAALSLRGHAAMPGSKARTAGSRAATDERLEVEALSRASTMVLDAEQRDVAQVRDNGYHIEAKRRANNLVFYAARLLERPGGKEEVDRLDLAPRVPGFIERLLPDAIETATDLNQLHSVGCYYSASGHLRDAHRAGARMLQLVASPEAAGDQTSRASLTEALNWCTQSVAAVDHAR